MTTIAGVALGPHGADAADVVAVARHRATVRLTEEARAAMEETAAVVAQLAASDSPAYGISTGFGSLAHTPIPEARRTELQRALIRSHAAGMGPPVEREVVRAMLFLRARSLAMGRSGARPLLAETMLAMLAADIDPVVPEHGSLGASGDLAPLAACALAMLGEGEVLGADAPDGSPGAPVPAAVALAAAGIESPTLGPKEGLALINGTDGILGMLVLALADLRDLLKVADVAAAVTTEALLGTDRTFDADLVALRPQPGQAVSAANLRALLSGSEIVASHRHGDPRVQDAYSIRCSPQVHGAARDTVVNATVTAGTNCARRSTTRWSCPMGASSRAATSMALPSPSRATSSRSPPPRRGRSPSAHRPAARQDPLHGLPPFLAPDAGVDSGLMIAQYTQAAMVAENRRLAAPASVDSLPTSAMQEDHVSMGWGAARKLRASVDNLRRILAVELSCGCRALDLREPLRPAPGTAAARAVVAAGVPGPGPDRWLAPELAAVEEMLRSGAVTTAVEAEIGGLS